MGNLLILDGPQRIQRLISLIPRLPQVGQRTQEFSLSLFLRSRELGHGILSRAFRLANQSHTATVVACVNDAIASEIIEAGVVTDGGMGERGVNVVTCLARHETRPQSLSPWVNRDDVSLWGARPRI